MNNEFWLHIHTTALTLVELNKSENVGIRALSSYLDTIDIAYDKVFDPVDHYPEYVATIFCKAVGNALMRIDKLNRNIP